MSTAKAPAAPSGRICEKGYRPIGYVMPSTRTVFCRKELREKVEARIRLFLGLKSAHTDRFCCNQLRENIGAILYRSRSQRARTDFQSVATFMIVLIMKLMPHYALFINTGI